MRCVTFVVGLVAVFAYLVVESPVNPAELLTEDVKKAVIAMFWGTAALDAIEVFNRDS